MDRATYWALEREFRKINKGSTVPYNVLHGSALTALGMHDAAIELHHFALLDRPRDAESFAIMMTIMDMAPGYGVAQAQSYRREWAARFSGPRFAHHGNRPDPDRRLRVGYVSGDLRGHAAARACGQVILNHDGFDLVAYNTLDFPEDAASSAFRRKFGLWRDVGKLPDRDFCAVVREDGIDILVDLSGHSHGNRLRAFTMKPAPVQVTGWGYTTGTGIAAFDGMFSDPVMTPLEDRHLYAEPILDLPCVISAYFADPLPVVSPLPAASQGFVTFGVVTRLAKITDSSLRLWARVLERIPESILLIKAVGINAEMVQERIFRIFGERGVEPKRLILHAGQAGWTAHMRVYQDIDIGLDPVPHGGGTTGVEALMMGVPTVTLRYPSVTGRLGAAIMTGAGEPGWIAETEDEYVSLAQGKCTDIRTLAALRQGLRARLRASKIGDGAAYCRAVEAHYRALWRAWCNANKGADLTSRELASSVRS